MSKLLEILPAERREAAQAALKAAFGAGAPGALERMRGGASGAWLGKLEVNERSYVLRLEGSGSRARNPHQYVCMQIAADTGVAPRVHYVDVDAGIAIMDFVRAEPIAKYPGGPKELAAALGRLAARLQETAVFPALHDYPELLGRIMGMLSDPNFFAAGLLTPHCELFARIREAFPWRDSALVSAHNDPNPQNVLFDGRRLWLVDWETACCNEPLVDVAMLAENFLPSAELEGALLEAWLGRSADAQLRARLKLLRILSRLYYAGILLSIGRAGAALSAPDSDLSAPTPEQFGAAVANLKPGSPDTLYVLGKMLLAKFLRGAETTGFEEALATVRG